MDGSATAALANEVTISTDGLLILLIVCMVIVAGGFVLMYRAVNKHVEDCAGYRRGFHATDKTLSDEIKAVDTKVDVMQNDLDWIKRHMGYKGEDQ